MDVAERRICLLLQALEHLPERALGAMLLHFGSPAALWQSDPSVWPSLGVPDRAVAELQALRDDERRARFDVEHQLAALARMSAGLLTLADPAYPPLLRQIFDPPPLLYYRGNADALQWPQVAVVGSRRASAVALRAARDFAAGLAANGLTVCSGLALGVDGAAHGGALEVGGSSVAVTATGIDRVYPRRHSQLAEALLESGCMVTEFAPGMPPLGQNFPRRNRIISGLSLGVLVVEAALPSGSLITARTALEQGREVFALPWSPYHNNGAGCLSLLRDGATLAQRVEDLIAELGPLDLARQQADPVSAAAPESGLLALIGCEPVSLDELAAQGDLPLPQLLAELSALEVAGQICRTSEGYTLTGR